MNAIKLNICIFVFTYLIHIYAVYLNGAWCGVNLFNWNTWGNITRSGSFTCRGLDWIVQYSTNVMASIIAIFTALVTSKWTAYAYNRN